MRASPTSPGSAHETLVPATPLCPDGRPAAPGRTAVLLTLEFLRHQPDSDHTDSDCQRTVVGTTGGAPDARLAGNHAVHGTRRGRQRYRVPGHRTGSTLGRTYHHRAHRPARHGA